MANDHVTLVDVGGEGPEDVLVDDNDTVYTGLADGRIVRTTGTTAPVETIARVPGRPLGLEFLGPDRLLVCASDRGLLTVDISTGAVHTLLDRVAGTPLLACNNAAVTADGTIYFTDSSQRYRIPQWRTDIIRRTATGRLLRRDPDGTVTVLLDGLEFANGVALARDGSYVAVAETATRRLHRVWLAGPQVGSSEVFVDGLFGYPDNISTGSDGLIWVAVASGRVGALDAVRRMPAAVRVLASRVPQRLLPRPRLAVGVVGVDDSGAVVRAYRGWIPGLTMLTGVREREGTLYLGSLNGRVIGVAAR